MIPPDPGLDPLRHAFTALAEDAPPASGCPDPERLWKAARSELTPEEGRAAVLHLVECPPCAEAWRLAMELRTADAAQAVSRPRWWGGALPVAAAVAAVALAGVVLRHGGSTVPGYRAQYREAIRALVSEDRPLPRSACVLRWSSLPPGARYDLRVATPSLAVLYTARNLTDTEHTVPAAALATLPPGARLLWQVEAVAADGSRTASPAFLARLQ